MDQIHEEPPVDQDAVYSWLRDLLWAALIGGAGFALVGLVVGIYVAIGRH